MVANIVTVQPDVRVHRLNLNLEAPLAHLNAPTIHLQLQRLRATTESTAPERIVVPQSVTAFTDPEGGASQPERLILVQNFFEELRQVVPE